VTLTVDQSEALVLIIADDGGLGKSIKCVGPNRIKAKASSLIILACPAQVRSGGEMPLIGM